MSLVSSVVRLFRKGLDLYGQNQLLQLGEDRTLAKQVRASREKQQDAKKAGDAVDDMSDADVERVLGDEGYRD